MNDMEQGTFFLKHKKPEKPEAKKRNRRKPKQKRSEQNERESDPRLSTNQKVQAGVDVPGLTAEDQRKKMVEESARIRLELKSRNEDFQKQNLVEQKVLKESLARQKREYEAKLKAAQMEAVELRRKLHEKELATASLMEWKNAQMEAKQRRLERNHRKSGTTRVTQIPFSASTNQMASTNQRESTNQNLQIPGHVPDDRDESFVNAKKQRMKMREESARIRLELKGRNEDLQNEADELKRKLHLAAMDAIKYRKSSEEMKMKLGKCKATNVALRHKSEAVKDLGFKPFDHSPKVPSVKRKIFIFGHDAYSIRSERVAHVIPKPVPKAKANDNHGFGGDSKRGTISTIRNMNDSDGSRRKENEIKIQEMMVQLGKDRKKIRELEKAKLLNKFEEQKYHESKRDTKEMKGSSANEGDDSDEKVKARILRASGRKSSSKSSSRKSESDRRRTKSWT